MQAYLNGRWSPLEALTLSPLDRGFLFGDGIYEVLLAHNDRPLLVAEHFARLSRSLAGVGIPNPFTSDTFRALCQRLAQQHTTPLSQLYIQITRGAGPTRSHSWDAPLIPTVFGLCQAYTPLDEAAWQAGRHAITLPDPRWAWSQYKSISLIANILALQEAQAQNAHEALLVRDGYLVEGSANNVFVVDVQGRLCTPPECDAMLSGITRATVLHLMRERGWECEERPVALATLHTAQECLLTSSLRGVCPVTFIDQRPVGAGVAGPWAHRLREAYQAFCQIAVCADEETENA